MKVCTTCGYRSHHPDATEAQADFYFRKHSCAKHLTETAAANRQAARMGAIDRTPQPCRHKYTTHEHGTRTCYVRDRCRCEPCTAANAAAEAHRSRQQAYGRYDALVDADPVRAHVRRITAAGMGLKQVAKVSGVAHGAVSRLMRGESRRVQTSTANRLYAIDLDAGLDLAAKTVLTYEASRITHRKLQALVALGWSMTRLGKRLGHTHGTGIIAIACARRPVTAATARTVDRLFAELCMTPPPQTDPGDRASATRARRFAQRHGWVPPLALDDLDLTQEGDVELELSEPGLDEVVVLRRLDGDRSIRVTRAEGGEIARRWRATGRSDAEMERVTGLNPSRYPAEEHVS